MPHKKRPAFEAAVTDSPLFKLALEIRIMIYELLLIQEGGMCIPSDIFVRRDYGRTGSTPFECTGCGLVFLSDHGCVQHIKKRHPCFANIDCSNRQYVRPRRPLLPEVSISLLQTCRLVRFEASPVLYSKNSFHFSDPGTASNFRWGTDIAQAGAAQEIGIKIAGNDFYHVLSWETYLTKRTHSLGQDFSHLKRVIISFFSLQVGNVHLRRMSKGLRERSRGLDWVLVLMLNDEKMLDCLEVLVDREDDSMNGKKEVRRHIWANKEGGRWKNALLWWGFSGEAVPQRYRLIGDQP